MIQKCILKCITNNCKPLKNFDFRKNWAIFLLYVYLAWKVSTWVFYSYLMGAWILLPVFCFIWSYKWKFWDFAKNHIKHGRQQQKHLKRIKMLQQEHTKRVKYYYIDFKVNTHNSLLPLSSTSFFRRRSRNFRKIR